MALDEPGEAKLRGIKFCITGPKHCFLTPSTGILPTSVLSLVKIKNLQKSKVHLSVSFRKDWLIVATRRLINESFVLSRNNVHDQIEVKIV